MPIFRFSRRPNIQQLKSEEDVDGLIDALGYQDDQNVRLAAASALGKLGDSKAVDPLINAFDDDSIVKEVAVISLGEIGDSKAVLPLISLLEDENWEGRTSAVKALGKIGDTRAVKPLLDILKGNNQTLKWIAEKALETITGESFGEDVTK
jgi:HEAT repeat protein